MNTILQAIGFIITGIIITIIFGKVRSWIIKKSIKTAKEIIYPKDFRCDGCGICEACIHYANEEILKDTVKNNSETFQWNKFFKGMFSFNAVEAAKDIYGLFNIRKICVYLMILSIFYGYGVYKGRLGKPVKFNLNYEKAFKMKIDGHYLVKPKNSQNLQIEDKDGTIIKTIKAEDMPDLARKLRPYGFVFEPYAIAGVGIGEKYIGTEGGLGTNFAKCYSWRLNASLTNRGIYVGTGYKLEKLNMNNTSLNLSYGKGWKGDDRILFGLAIEF